MSITWQVWQNGNIGRVEMKLSKNYKNDKKTNSDKKLKKKSCFHMNRVRTDLTKILQKSCFYMKYLRKYVSAKRLWNHSCTV